MSPFVYKMPCVALALAAIGGCAGNGAGLDANGQPIGAGGAGAPAGLQLDANHSYALLVGVASQEVGTFLRVKQGDPDNSYLVLKLQGDQRISGTRMPFGEPYLNQATINVIRQWITNGAPKAMSLGEARPMALGSFFVTVTSPLADSVVSFPVAQIVVAFNRQVDVSLVNDTTVRLERISMTSADGSAAPLATSMALVNIRFPRLFFPSLLTAMCLIALRAHAEPYLRDSNAANVTSTLQAAACATHSGTCSHRRSCLCSTWTRARTRGLARSRTSSRSAVICVMTPRYRRWLAASGL